MVYAVLVHSLDGKGSIFHSQFYTAEGNDAARKTRQQQIIHHVYQEHVFRLQCTAGRRGGPQGETLAGGDAGNSKVGGSWACGANSAARTARRRARPQNAFPVDGLHRRGCGTGLGWVPVAVIPGVWQLV